MAVRSSILHGSVARTWMSRSFKIQLSLNPGSAAASAAGASGAVSSSGTVNPFAPAPVAPVAVPAAAATPVKEAPVGPISPFSTLPAITMPVEIDSSDVIRVIEQFLLEHNLTRTLRTLQDESGVALNIVDSPQRFADDIINGRWDLVLSACAHIALPAPRFYDLFEQIVVEFAEMREVDAGRALLRSAAPLQHMRSGAPDRFARLERLLQRNEFAPADAYLPGWSKERKRSVIAAEMKDDVTSAPASRLLALLTDALKWQAHTGRLPREAFSTAPAGVSAGGGAVSSGSGEVLGSGIDLLTGAAVSAAAAAEQPTTALSRTLRLGAVGSGTNAEVCTFTPNGALLVTGSSDGFIESWDWTTGALAKELPYQAADELLLHDDAVSALAFSADGELLASASVRGDVKVWRYYTGEALRKFPTAHPGAVASLAFSPDGTQVLTAGHDGVARILGLRSGNTVKEFRGHKSFLSSAQFSADGSLVFTASTDGALKTWNATSGDCVATLVPGERLAAAHAQAHPGAPPRPGLATTPVVACLRIPQRPDLLYVVTRGGAAALVAAKTNTVLQVFTPTLARTDKPLPVPEFVGGCVSAKGKYVYALASDSVVYCFDVDTAVTVAAFKAHNKEALALAQHPFHPALVTTAQDSTARVWT